MLYLHVVLFNNFPNILKPRIKLFVISIFFVEFYVYFNTLIVIIKKRSCFVNIAMRVKDWFWNSLKTVTLRQCYYFETVPERCPVRNSFPTSIMLQVFLENVMWRKSFQYWQEQQTIISLGLQSFDDKIWPSSLFENGIYQFNNSKNESLLNLCFKWWFW